MIWINDEYLINLFMLSLVSRYSELTLEMLQAIIYHKWLFSK